VFHVRRLRNKAARMRHQNKYQDVAATATRATAPRRDGHWQRQRTDECED